MEKEELAQTGFKLPKILWQNFKIKAIKENKKIGNKLIELMQEYVDKK